jgi:hypothetical protein
VLGPAEDEEDDDEPSEYTGFAALAGALADWPEFDEIMNEVVAGRRNDRYRDVSFLDELG